MTTTTVPAHPSDIGLPYPAWLDGQQEMVDYVNSSDKRFVILQAGPGRGKSGVAVALAQLMVGKSVCILATTKALVSQYLTEFKNLGFAMIEGRSTYNCDLDASYNAATAPCVSGFKCQLKASGKCTYYRLKAQAQVSRVVITDVAYFLTTYLYADGLRLKKLPFDVVVIDEGDLLESWLLNTVVIKVTRSTFRRVLNGIGFPSSIEIPVWKEWAEEHLVDAKQAFANAENELRVASGDGEVADVPPALRGAYRRAETVLATLKSVLSIPESEHWVVEVGQGDKDGQYDDQGPGFELKPVWAAPYAQRLLYDHATEKIVFMSGTIPSGQQFAKLVGIPDGEWDYKEFGGVFPVSHRPFYYIPTVKVHHGMTSSSLDMLIARVDQIVSDRLDRKGIIQTGSYWMAEEVYSRSMWGGQDGFMLRHGQGGLERALVRFRAADAPAILVSPALTRGVDLPGRLCLIPGTRVRTADGFKLIEDIRVGDRVFSHTGTLRRVSATYKRGYEGELVGIESSYGGSTAWMTPGHPVAVLPPENRLNARSVSWLPAGALSKETFLAYPYRRLPTRSTAQPPDQGMFNGRRRRYLSRYRRRDLGVGSLPICDSLYRIAGIYAADGNLIKSGSIHLHRTKYVGVHLTLGSQQERERVLFENDLTSLGLHFGYLKVKDKNAVRVTCTSQLLAWWLKTRVGIGSSHKRVPPEVFYSRMAAPFLEGYLLGDGHLSSPGLVTTMTISPLLAYGLRDLVASLGLPFPPRVTDGKFVLSNHGADAIRLKSLINLEDGYSPSQRVTRRRIQFGKRFVAARPITLQRRWYSGDVINLSVEEEESYLLEGVAVHNCTYTIQVRVPWPSLVTQQMMARKEADPLYSAYVTALQIEQQAYRGLRGPEDLNEIFMLDDVWRWFRAAYRDFFSESFRESWRDTQRIPPPMDISALDI